jgi:hypothetical protein
VAGRKPAEQGNHQSNQKKRDAMTDNRSESSGKKENPDFVKAPENQLRPTKIRSQQNRHLMVWDRRGERDKRSPENFVEHMISCAQIRPRQKYAGRC